MDTEAIREIAKIIGELGSEARTVLLTWFALKLTLHIIWGGLLLIVIIIGAKLIEKWCIRTAQYRVWEQMIGPGHSSYYDAITNAIKKHVESLKRGER